MTIVFPGLRCEMVLVVDSIGSEGLLGTEELQSCLPHQLDLHTSQLWADGQSTLQLHQQRQAVRASGHVKGSLVMPPDSEMVVPVSIRSPSGIPPGRCSMIEPDLDIMESYVVLVGCTLVDVWPPCIGLVCKVYCSLTRVLMCCLRSSMWVLWCLCGWFRSPDQC